MVSEPDATLQSPLQDHQLMSKRRVLSFKPQLRLEWRGQDGQSEAEQPNHPANLAAHLQGKRRLSLGQARRPVLPGADLRQPRRDR